MKRKIMLLSFLFLLTSYFTIGVHGLTTDTADKNLNFKTAVIETSAVNDSGIGNMLEITIIEPDVNKPDRIDIIVAKAGSESSTKDLTLYLKETGADTGIFKYTLYFSSIETNRQLLYLSGQDKVTIRYTDKTVPQGSTKDIIKTITWKYQSTILTLDKDSYTGYNTSAEVSLLNMELNRNSDKREFVDVEVSTDYSKTLRLKLRETKSDSGVFTGTLYFGRSTKSTKSTIKMSGNDSITVSYTNRSDSSDVTDCYADWSPQDGQISLDRAEYSGNSAPVSITLTDWDAAEDSGVKDEVKVTAKLQGKTTGKSVTLTETNRNSGIFAGTLYINDDKNNHPSIKLSPVDKLVLVYTDEDTTSGIDEERIANAVWSGISKAELSLDQTSYKGYDTYMTISLKDPDYNKRKTIVERMEVLIKTTNGKTNMKYFLRETGIDTGIFTATLKLSKGAPNISTVRVADSDEIMVLFVDKNVSGKASFLK